MVLIHIHTELEAVDVDRLVAVGARKLICPWEEDTGEKKEYFQFFALPGICPLTGTLLDDE